MSSIAVDVNVQERRLHSRIPCDIQDTNHRVVIRNMSEGGLYLESAHEYGVQENVSLSFVVPSTSDNKPVNISARVLRRQVIAEGSYRYGLSFEDLSNEVQQQIHSFLVTEGIYLKVKDVFLEVIPEESRTNFRRQASVVSDLHVDSLKVAELSILLEQAFRKAIFLPDWLTSVDDPEDLTVDSLVQFLNQQRVLH